MAYIRMCVQMYQYCITRRNYIFLLAETVACVAYFAALELTLDQI